MINWKEQWALHAPHFKDGLVHVECGVSFVLKPGPGFGDLSHPTTNLMLELMPRYVKGKDVIDIGCGSGVLSIAAKLMGANSVRGVDICPLAVEHARENAKLNGLDIEFSTKPVSKVDGVVLMNMISSEQRFMWEKLCTLSILSGFLEDEVVDFPVVEEQACDGWKAIVTATKSSVYP